VLLLVTVRCGPWGLGSGCLHLFNHWAVALLRVHGTPVDGTWHNSTSSPQGQQTGHRKQQARPNRPYDMCKCYSTRPNPPRPSGKANGRSLTRAAACLVASTLCDCPTRCDVCGRRNTLYNVCTDLQLYRQASTQTATSLQRRWQRAGCSVYCVPRPQLESPETQCGAAHNAHQHACAPCHQADRHTRRAGRPCGARSVQRAGPRASWPSRRTRGGRSRTAPAP
jgi:hypothetical protein